MPNLILSNLNEQQLIATTSKAPVIRCLAGAGTGKTRVLTSRIAYMHDEMRVGTSNMLALTFTRLAAKEMKDRLKALVGEREVQKLFCGTFHSFCVKVLKEWGSQVGIEPNFTIYDEEDRTALLQAIIPDLGAKKIKVSDVIAQMQVWDKAWPEGDLGRVAHEYYYRLRQHNALDLDLLLHRAKDVLDIETVRAYYQNIYRYIFVDEYQDTSNPQNSIIKALSPEYLFVVGDDFQAIYGWRGANVYNILNFGPINGFAEPETIKLEQNYRSASPIVQAANQLIKHNETQTEKTLVTGRAGEPVLYSEFVNEEAEFENVAETIKTSNRPFSDYAVLARSNRQLQRLKEVLDKKDIPCQIVNAGGDIFKKAAVKGVLDFIAASLNTLDNITMKKAFAFPEPRTTAIQMDVMELNSLDSGLSLFHIMQGYEEHREFIEAITKMDKAFANIGHDAGAIFRYASDNVLGLYDYWEARGLVNRWEDIREANNQIKRWQDVQSEMNESTSYDAFLRWLRTKDIQERLLQEEEKNAVKLLTVHAAKGLEFPVVFIIGMNQGVFPSKKSQDLEEERRLFYVAITRAKDFLLIYRAKERVVWGYHTEPTEPSQFIKEAGLRVSNEVMMYFQERYAAVKWRVAPGHWPNFQSKEEVDEWFEGMEKIMTVAFDKEATA